MIYATDMLSDVYTLDLFLAENNSEYLNDLREIVKTLRQREIGCSYRSYSSDGRYSS